MAGKYQDDPLAVSLSGVSDENTKPTELTKCLRGYIEVYGDDIRVLKPEEIWESVRKVHGFDVNFETVKNTLDNLKRRGNDLTDDEDSEEDTKFTVPEVVEKNRGSSVGDSVRNGRKLKVKVLTKDLLEVVSVTMDDDAVHSLISLKRALERKGIFISKTSVYRALEKLGRRITEKKPKTVAEILQYRRNGGTDNPDEVKDLSTDKVPVTLANKSTKPDRVTKPDKVTKSKPKSKFRALLPKPADPVNIAITMPTGPILVTPSLGTPILQNSGSPTRIQQLAIPGGLMQITRDRITSTPSTVRAVVPPAVLRTHVISGISPPTRPPISPTMPSKTISDGATRVGTNIVFNHSMQSTTNQHDPGPPIKIEIDDPSYTVSKEDSPTMSTTTPPPRLTTKHKDDDFHPTERLTKSVSPQLLSSNYTNVENDAKARAIQQFRLNKAIGKITTMRSQTQASRAPRKPSVVFHRPSSNSTPIPFRVRHEPSFSKTHRDDPRAHSIPVSNHINSRASSSYNRVPGRNTSRQGQRALQMMRAARNAQLRSLVRSGLHKLHPVSLPNVRSVNQMSTRRRLAARLHRHETVAPVYYQSEMDEEDFLPELEIDPPDNQGAVEEVSDQSEERTETKEGGCENSQLLREMFQEMTKEMRRLSQHMEAIQGQLHLIVDQMSSSLHHNQQSQRRHILGMDRNGHAMSMETTSPLSTEEHSADAMDDPDDGLNGQESLLDSGEVRIIPPLGTPESESLIRDVLDDARWEQMTPYAGAPRLAITLARYCIFGTKVLMESSVTGRNSKNPLNNTAMKKVKELLKEKYGSRCNQLEFEMVWKTSRESISQLCKRLRRKFQLTGKVNGGGQEDFILDCRP